MPDGLVVPETKESALASLAKPKEAIKDDDDDFFMGGGGIPGMSDDGKDDEKENRKNENRSVQKQVSKSYSLRFL